MLKVASVIASLSTRTGGPMINLVESVPHLRRAGVEVTIFTTDMGAPASTRAWRAGTTDFPDGADECDIRVFRAEPPRRVVYSPRLRRGLRSELVGFDLVRIHGLYLYPQYAGAAEARRLGLPYIVTPHGALDPWLQRHGRLRKTATNLAWQSRMLREAAAIHATTEAESALFDASIPAGPARRVVANGVATDVFKALPPRGRLRAELDIGPDTPIVLFLGRLARKKGIDILIRAIARVRNRNLALVIVGPDDEGLTPSLRRLAMEVGIADLTHFVGPLYGNSRLQALADSDLWALSSHTENFGNAVIEAMAAGVPTIISSEVNLASDVAAAQAGSVARPDPGAFGAELSRLLDDPGERARLGDAGRLLAARYDWRLIATQLAAMYREFAATPAAVRRATDL